MTWQPGEVGTAPPPLVRPAAVSGAFYPVDPVALTRMVDDLLTAAAPPVPEVAAVAYVLPHAAYGYSGPVAAAVFARLHHHAEAVSRVVLLGPAHHVPVRGCVVSTVDCWRTPLGDVPVDLYGAEYLINGGYAAPGDTPHVPEHSLEVQLPFLQRVLRGGVPVLPILIGAAPPGEVADAITAAARPAGTVVLCSTDLSHHLEDHAARAQDAVTGNAVLDLAADRIGPQDACGVYALRGILTWARRIGLRPRLLRQSTSADMGGDPGRVVGYGAFAFDA